jgi:hypothetical protein
MQGRFFSRIIVTKLHSYVCDHVRVSQILLEITFRSKCDKGHYVTAS